MNIIESLINLWQSTGIYKMLYLADEAGVVTLNTGFIKTLIMYVIVGVLIYLAIGRKFEPLLLLPIAFGMLLANLPGAGLYHPELFIDPNNPSAPLDIVKIIQQGGLMDFLYLGVKLGIYPSLIFLGVGAMTDFTPLISNPKSLILGAAAQFGIYVAFVGALCLGFSPAEAASIGIIGGADGHLQSTRDKADLILSFGKLTLPHMLMRAVLSEQIYRIQTIIAKHPYHRE